MSSVLITKRIENGLQNDVSIFLPSCIPIFHFVTFDSPFPAFIIAKKLVQNGSATNGTQFTQNLIKHYAVPEIIRLFRLSQYMGNPVG